MLRSGLFDKSSVAPENPSGRNNICNRFPVGITSLGDDNQNIRIQLAVHKYNSSSNSSTYNKHSLISPIKHSISRNSPKAKNYECEIDSSLRSDNKCGNQYEGVGNFPMVHLEKSSILYRPIKRFIRKGISNPEIPENRFLNHIPQLYSDPKPNTRSVLDVLQDLSKKRIHSKTENSYHKKRSQGLGGDAATNSEVAYKPLFIKKDKTLPISVKDGTTQTILPYCSDKSYTPFTVSSLAKNDISDPKAELRKKLAKQNNEIFASLSSSASPIFSLKRKIDKISNGKNDSRSEILTTKKPKLFDKQKNNFETNGIFINVNGMETNANGSSPKTDLTNKLKSGSAISPSGSNKDRLTTIFLDMQSESSKAQIFKSPSISKNSIENNTYNLNKTLVQTNTFIEETGEIQKDITWTKENLSAKKSVTTEPEKSQSSSHLVNTFQYPISKSNSLISSGIASKTNSSSLNNMFGSSSAPNFNFNTFLKSDGTPQNISLNSTGSSNSTTVFKLPDKSNKPDDICDSPSETSSVIKQKSDANDKEIVPKQFIFGNFSENETNKPDLNASKFGFGENSPANNISQSINDDTKATNPISTAYINTDSLAKSDALQFSFDIKNNTHTTTSINSLSKIPVSSSLLNSSNTITTVFSPSEKPKFTFGKPANHQNLLENFSKPRDETETRNNNLPITISASISQNPTTSSLFGQNCEKKYFACEAKSNGNETESAINIADGCQAKTENIEIQIPTTSQSTNNDSFKKSSVAPYESINTPITTQTCSPSVVTNHSKLLSQTSTLITVNEQNNKSSLFCDSLGQKFINPELSNNAPDKPNNNALTEQKKVASFSFNLVQNLETQTKGSSLEQNNQPNLFSFGQKSKEESCKNNNFESTSLIPAPNFGQKSSNSVTESNLNSSTVFGQNNSQTSQGIEQFNHLPSNQSKNSDTKTTNSFGIKNETIPFGSVFGQNSSSFSAKTPIFGTSDNKNLSGAGFGVSNNQPNTIFGISTTAISGTEFKATTTSSDFVVPSMGFVSKSTNTFGITTTAQPCNTFGATTTTKPTFTFGSSATTQASNAFSATTTAQSTNTFGLSTTSHLNNIFSSPANQLNVFGTSTTQPINAFGSNTSKVTNTFGAPATPQSSTGFGISSSSPFAQSFVQNPIKTSTTSGQPSVNIFGQNTGASSTVSNAFNLPSNNSFSSSTPNIFGQKSNEQGSIFGQGLKVQTSPFRQTPVSQSFNAVMSTSNIKGFTTSPPNTTTSSVFTFGASSQGSAFNFGNNLSTSANSTSPPFAFNSPSNDTFKLGVSSAKEGSGFGGNNTSTFTFGAQTNNNISMAIKPTETAFNFGSGQTTTTPAFNFSSHSASPVFSFNGSGSNTGSSSTFNFGTPQTGGSFGQPTPSPVATFSAPGTFSIGSGSSQSRQRASSRLRRRP